MLENAFLGFPQGIFRPFLANLGSFWGVLGAQFFRLNYPYFYWIVEYYVMIYENIDNEKGLKMHKWVFHGLSMVN